MKIQLITQNIKPIALKTKTNSNPILKNNQTDSFERQNVAFKGAAEVAEIAAKEALKSKVLISITKQGKEGVEEFCKDLPTYKTTFTIFRDFLIDNYAKFTAITSPEGIKVSRQEALKGFVDAHNNLDNATRFWEEIVGEEGSQARHRFGELSQTEDNWNLIHPVARFVAKARENVMPNRFREKMTVEQWITSFMDFCSK